MLLREVEYARPATIEEAVSVLAAHDGARAARRRADPRQRDEGSARRRRTCSSTSRISTSCATIGFSSDGMLEIGAMVTCTQLMGSSEVDVARPILAEVAATIADVQVRNRGHDRRQRLRERPDEPLPAAPRRARRDLHDSRAGRRAHGVRRRVLPRRLHDRRRRGRAAHEDQRAGVERRGRRLRRAHDRRARHVHRQRRGDGVRRRAHVSRSAASPPSPVRATAMEERLAGGDYSEDAVRAAAAGPRRLARSAVGRPRLGRLPSPPRRGLRRRAPCCRRRRRRK